MNNTTRKKQNIQIITLASGCFWCTEALLKRVKGVMKVTSGYSGGWKENPTYEEVCAGRTGHAEATQVEYDPRTVSFENLLQVFFKTFDPMQKNHQGNDEGPQYRSAIFYHTDEQRQIGEKVRDELNKSGLYDKPIATEITKFTHFYPAEKYHQNFYENNRNHPYCRAIIDPKLHKLFSS
ncbi:MAG: peptide-methionine (S)-S-oxide reductase MsrA [Candidatus Roizmanbacteria bacterium]|nr:peptide-methionine (S)-S-oxide reductase MsrA [Candidatus Roizmanbacteria bacterium]